MPFKFNPTTSQLDFVVADKFIPPYHIASGEICTIPTRREMAIHEELFIEGALNVVGLLVLDDAWPEDWDPVEAESYSYNGDGTVNYVETFSDSSLVSTFRTSRTDFTYSGGYPATEVKKEYAAGGSTIVRTFTTTYTFSSGVLISKVSVVT